MENRKAARPSQFAQSSRVPPPIFHFLLSIFAALIVLAGCGAPGEPVERKAPIPNAITDLAATQQGDNVILTFTLPKESVEGRELKQPPAIEIFRDFQTVSTGAAPPSRSAAPTLLVTIPSAMVVQYDTRNQIRYVDSLQPENFTQHPGAQAVYIVRTRTSPKKASANSNAANLRVAPAADQITGLKAEVTHQGIVLTWTPPQKTAVGPAPPIVLYRIFRNEVISASSPPASTPVSNSEKPGVQIGDCPAPPFRDTQIQFGKTYVYTVRSVAQYPDVQVESLDSPSVQVSPLDTFPPSAPQGLVAVLVPAQGAAPAYFDLSWSISAENDIAGYNIYRTEQERAAGQKQNPELLLTPAFRDMNTIPGHRYFYTVTAVDRAGNESPASAAASGEVAAASPAGASAEDPRKAQPRP
jgi:nitrous oxide reductase accessory protein NosL